MASLLDQISIDLKAIQTENPLPKMSVDPLNLTLLPKQHDLFAMSRLTMHNQDQYSNAGCFSKSLRWCLSDAIDLQSLSLIQVELRETRKKAEK